jgi:hypothetical protein
VLSIEVKKWLAEAISEISFYRQSGLNPDRDQEAASISPEDERREIADFFGWSIFSLYKVLSNERDRAKELQWTKKISKEKEEEILAFIESMKTTHLVAVLDEEYLRECYAAATQVRNNGGLTLVDKRYFRFGRCLLHTIRKCINVEAWNRHGDKIMETSAKAVKNDKTLVFLFMEASQYSNLEDELKQKVMMELIMKVLHARAAAEHNKLKEAQTNREAKGSISTSLRVELKVLGRRKRVVDETMVETDRLKNTGKMGEDKRRKKNTKTKDSTQTDQTGSS